MHFLKTISKIKIHDKNIYGYGNIIDLLEKHDIEFRDFNKQLIIDFSNSDFIEFKLFEELMTVLQKNSSQFILVFK